ncbi:hypothetical protein NC651_020362 [Populus alba x Populus x berolinensis]|nr:hypothetical protein NC651_020362 [Populus alba x Populus x berolinensis]
MTFLDSKPAFTKKRWNTGGAFKPVTKDWRAPCPLQIKAHNNAFLASSASTPTSSINPFCHSFI